MAILSALNAPPPPPAPTLLADSSFRFQLIHHVLKEACPALTTSSKGVLTPLAWLVSYIILMQTLQETEVETMPFVQDHPPAKWETWVENPGLLISKPKSFMFFAPSQILLIPSAHPLRKRM